MVTTPMVNQRLEESKRLLAEYSLSLPNQDEGYQAIAALLVDAIIDNDVQTLLSMLDELLRLHTLLVQALPSDGVISHLGVSALLSVVSLALDRCLPELGEDTAKVLYYLREEGAVESSARWWDVIPSIQQMLAELREAGCVTSRRIDTKIWWELTPRGLAALNRYRAKEVELPRVPSGISRNGGPR